MAKPCLPPLTGHAPLDFSLPAGACDSHAHAFGPYARHRLADDRSYTPDEFPAEAFIAHLDRFGLTRGVLVTGSASGTDNGVMLEALERYPERLRGVAVPSTHTGPNELARWHDAGVRGIRVNLYQRDGHVVYRNGIGLEVVETMASHLRRLGWHVQVWIHAPDLPGLSTRLLRLDVPLVVDHMGRMSTQRGIDDPGFSHLVHMVEKGDAWVKISGADRNTVQLSPYDDVDVFAHTLLRANPDRVVWGSDWPHINYYEPHKVPNDGVLLNLVSRWIPDAAMRQRVLAKNPATLYGFEPLR